MEATNDIEKKYKKWIIILSIAIPLVVAVLFGVKIPDAKPLTFLPPIYATINGITAVVLIAAVIAIKNKKVKLHEMLMKVCIGLSIAFLGMYVAYHMTSDSTSFGGEGLIKYVYFFILITHIVLSIAIIPLVLITYVKALRINQAHMVLTYFPTPDAIPLVLDNLIKGIYSASRRTDLEPVYSFNGSGMWLERMKGQGIRMGNPNKLDLWTGLRLRMSAQNMDI
jgi:putative membrane protein